MENGKQLLLRSYDMPLNENEKQHLQDELTQSEALKEEKERLDNMRTKIASFETDFSDGFTEKLMQRIADKGEFAFLSVFRTIALSGAAVIVLVLLTVYFVDGSLTLDSLLGLNGYAPGLGLLSIF